MKESWWLYISISLILLWLLLMGAKMDESIEINKQILSELKDLNYNAKMYEEWLKTISKPDHLY